MARRARTRAPSPRSTSLDLDREKRYPPRVARAPQPERVAQMQAAGRVAAQAYRYYNATSSSAATSDPLVEGRFPDGGALGALVAELEARAPSIHYIDIIYTVQYSTVHSTVQYSTVYSTVQYTVHSTVRYGTVRCGTGQYSTAQYATVHSSHF